MVASNAKPIKFVFEGKSRMKEIDSNTTNQDQTLEGQIQVRLVWLLFPVTLLVAGNWRN